MPVNLITQYVLQDLNHEALWQVSTTIILLALTSLRYGTPRDIFLFHAQFVLAEHLTFLLHCSS